VALEIRLDAVHFEGSKLAWAHPTGTIQKFTPFSNTTFIQLTLVEYLYTKLFIYSPGVR